MLCSGKKGRDIFGEEWDYTDETWEAQYRQEWLELVCAAPYTSYKSLDELVQRYSRGTLGAALGCDVSFESDRPEAVTSVMRAIALTLFGVTLSAVELMQRVWRSLLTQMVASLASPDGDSVFGVPNIRASIMAGSSSFALEALHLHGTPVTYEQEISDSKSDKGEWRLTCHYTTADGSVATWVDKMIVRQAVREAGFRGIPDREAAFNGLSEAPLPKPQDATGAEAEILLCVFGEEPVATAAKGCVFVLLTQPRKEGDRVISLKVVSRELRMGIPENRIDIEGKPPRPDVRFYENTE